MLVDLGKIVLNYSWKGIWAWLLYADGQEYFDYNFGSFWFESFPQKNSGTNFHTCRH